MTAVWVSQHRHPLGSGPVLCHAEDPAGPVRVRLDPKTVPAAACGAVLDPVDLWCRSAWLVHAAGCARAHGMPPPCLCVELCGPCLYWAGWPDELTP